MDFDPERQPSEENINDLQTARLALRGALDSMRSLQEINSRLKGQLQDSANQERMLHQRLEGVQSEIANLKTALEQSRKTESVDTSMAAELRLREKELQEQFLRKEAAFKQQMMDRDLSLASEWFAKERRLVEEHERTLKDERQRNETEAEKRKLEIAAVRREWESDVRRQESEIRSHYSQLLDEQKALYANLINERTGAVRSEYESSHEHLVKQNREFEALSHRQEAELVMLRERIVTLTHDAQERQESLSARVKELEHQLRAEQVERHASEDKRLQLERQQERHLADLQETRGQLVHVQQELQALQAQWTASQQQHLERTKQSQTLEQELRTQHSRLEEETRKRERVLTQRLAAYEEALERLCTDREQRLDAELRTVLQNELARLSKNPDPSNPG
jgi:hypothetical protein